VGITADNPDQPIELKAFHCKIINDTENLAKEKRSNRPLSDMGGGNLAAIQQNYWRIKQEAQDIATEVMEAMLNDPAREHLVAKK